MRGRAPILWLAAALQLAGCAGAVSEARLAAVREQMVQVAVIDAGVGDPAVVAAMRAIPRHAFVPREQRSRAYHDMALPIGEGQTISSPFIVAAMTEALELSPGDRVLEVGTGSGYQAAVLSALGAEVFTIEIVPALAERAARTLAELGYGNVSVREGDGFLGWPEQAPFDRIIVTCSPDAVPAPLVRQLAPDGLIVIPVGERYQQTLYRMRLVDGALVRESLRPTLFVPMTGRADGGAPATPTRVVNGGFEAPPDERGFLPGWFDQRRAERRTSDEAPEGGQVLHFHNSSPGRAAHAMQGLASDGRSLAAVDLLAWVRLQDVVAYADGEAPQVALHVFDAGQTEVAHVRLGPLGGSAPWRQLRARLPLPESARHAVLRLGLFGGTGSVEFDAVEVVPVPR